MAEKETTPAGQGDSSPSTQPQGGAATKRAPVPKARLSAAEIEPRRLEHERRVAGPAKYSGGGK